MSEKQTRNPEADVQTINDLYIQAAACLKLWQEYKKTEIAPSLNNPYLLSVKVSLPEFNGRRIEIEYDRPSHTDDPTQVDDDYPLFMEDEHGNNIWATWIGIKGFDTNGKLINDIQVIHSCNDIMGDPHDGVADDLALQPGQDPEVPTMPVTMLEAKNLMGHFEWAAQELREQEA